MATTSLSVHAPVSDDFPEIKSQEDCEATQVLTQPLEKEDLHEFP